MLLMEILLDKPNEFQKVPFTFSDGASISCVEEESKPNEGHKQATRVFKSPAGSGADFFSKLRSLGELGSFCLSSGS